MIKKAFVMKLKSESVVADYKKAHDEIWPELVDVLHKYGVKNYSIHLHRSTLTLFARCDISDEELWTRIGSTEVCQRWWSVMSSFMILAEEGKLAPFSEELEEMFWME